MNFDHILEKNISLKFFLIYCAMNYNKTEQSQPLEKLPNMIEEVRCNMIYYTLLTLKDNDVLATTYARELEETSRCDTIRNLSTLRSTFKLHVDRSDSERMKRILAFEETDFDEKFAQQSVVHYGQYHRQEFAAALTWSSWLYYQTIERTAAAFAILGGMYGSHRVIANSTDYLRKKSLLRSIRSQGLTK